MSGELTLTQEALDRHLPPICDARGERLSAVTHPGMVDGPEGYSEFDQDIHNVEDIDPDAPEADVMDFVRINSKPLPYYMNIVRDGTPRLEAPDITEVKVRVATSLAKLLGGSLQAQGDEDYFFYIGQPSGNEDAENKPRADRAYLADDRQAVTPAVHDVGSFIGLPFILSDFRDIRFDTGSLDKTVAIKINHLAEREMPRNIGMISLGGIFELDTNDPEQVEAYNDRLRTEHQKIVGNLTDAGAIVVSVIADPRIKPLGYDVSGTDQQIAFAIDSIAKQA